MIAFIAKMADRGCPLSHARLKEHVDSICKARLSDKFPLAGVGQNWTYCFAQRNAEKIKIAHPRPLEDKHGCATNPHTNNAWWKLLGETIEKYGERCDVSLTEETTNTKHTHKWSEAQ